MEHCRTYYQEFLIEEFSKYYSVIYILDILILPQDK